MTLSGMASWVGSMYPFGWALAGIMMVFLVIFCIAFYVYTSLAWSTILKKMKYKNYWLAWIPIVRIAPALQLGGFNWAWTFLILIPILGWIALLVLLTISLWKIFEKRKYPGWLSLSLVAIYIPLLSGIGIIAYLIIIGLVAWQKR